MGKLIEQPIKALFNGVSRQPHNVRLTSQVEEANNTLLSVVTGGFEKRPAAQNALTVTGLASSGTYAFHPIDRDPFEQYIILVDSAGVLKVYDVVNDAAKTVNAYASAITTYLTSPDPQNDLAFVTIADYTIIVNRTKTTAMSAATATTLDGAINSSQTSITLTSVTGFPTKGAVLIGTEKITYTGISSNDLIGVTRGASSTSAASHSDDAAVAPCVIAYVDTFGDLTVGGAVGVYGITNTASDFDDYFVVFDDDTQAWVETVDPSVANSFDATTLPHKLVRNADGSWTVSTIAWTSRGVGDSVSVPDPQFIGKKMSDAFFFKNRLGLLADENVFFSQSGDFFNLWPDKAAEVLDTDPIDVAASTTKVTLLRWAIPFRKTLFLSSDRAQFELSSSGTLTPSAAVVDLATNYSTDNLSKPVALGDELYFAGKSGANSVIYEYFVEDDTLTNVAIDITKHAEGYVPSDVTMMVGDPTTGRLFCVTDVAASDGNFDELYVYSVYFDGAEKAQSAWTKWDVNCTKIHGIGVIDGNLYIFVNRDGSFFIERIPLMAEVADATLGHAIMLDGRVDLTGSYSSGTGLTSWTLPYAHNTTAQGILPSAFGTNAGKKLALTYGGQATCTITVTDYANIAVGTTIVLTSQSGTSTTFTSEAISGSAPSATNGWRPNASNDTTADNLFTAINAHSDYSVSNPAANVVTITRVAEGSENLTVTSSDSTRLAVTNFVNTSGALTAVGDYSASAATFGVPYEMRVEFSRQYVREADGSSIIRGRYQIRTMRVYFTDTGYFQAVVTADSRTAKTYTMTGRILGSASNIIGKPALLTDTWQFPIKSRGDTVKIEIVNDSHLPSTINSASFVGFFNEITRQE